MKQRSSYLILTLLCFALAAAALLAACERSTPVRPEPDYAAAAPPLMALDAEPSGITHFNNLSTGDLTASDDVTVGDDLTVTDAANIKGSLSDSAGALTLADNVLIDGQADAAQLVIQGYTTQTNKTLTVEQSDGTDKFTVDNSGNLVVAGTCDLVGNVADSGGALTVADNVLIDGQADGNQLIVQGYTTQTNKLLILEQSDGTDKLTVDNSGNLVVAGTADLVGTIADSGGTLTIGDNAAITGTLDAQGNIADSAGTLTIADDVLIDGASDANQLIVQGYTTQTNSLLILEQSDGTDKFTVDNSGNLVVEGTSNLKGTISDSGGNVTLGDNLDITGTLDVQGGDITLQNDETISNGTNDLITLNAAKIGAGTTITVTGANATVVGGSKNEATTNWATVVGGYTNSAGGTLSTVVGGTNNSVTGNYSVGMGRNVTSNNQGSFVFCDANTSSCDDVANNTFNAEVAGGAYFGAGGMHYYIQPEIKTTNYSITNTNRTALFTNAGASGGITLTLPTAVAGLNFCVYISETQPITIAINAADQIHHLTNAAGDRITNSGTSGDSICLVAINATYWVPLQEIGTWSDAD